MRHRRFLAGAAATLAVLAGSTPDEVERTLRLEARRFRDRATS